jgi:ACR3 family arsenite transporter
MTRIMKKWIQHTQVSLYAIAVLLAIGVGLGQPKLRSVLEPLINPVLPVDSSGVNACL